MTFEVRLATSEDTHALAVLRYEFRATVTQAAEDREEFVARASLWMASRLSGQSAWRCWVAADNGRISGNLWLQTIEKIPNPAPELELHAYITNVYVEPAARAAGLAARLLESALAFCREAGVDSVILWPTELSRPLYARHGFAVPEDMMEAVLDAGRDFH
jgi:GNAT superfamily N-acetyltransferase